jgi:drug/metabolite transporter (DMT)-like permease
MKSQSKAYFAYLFICIVWGTTYLAIRIGVLHYPAFLFAGARQVLAGLILACVALVRSSKVNLSIKNLLYQAFIGFLLITIGNGLVTWSEQHVSSGLAALICSTMPISSVIISIISGRERLNGRVLIGMLLGFVGVGLIFQDNLQYTEGHLFAIGIVALFIATFGWALGSILNKNNKNVLNPLFNSAIQLFFGGVLMLLISPIADDYSHIVWWNKDGLMAFGYLVVFGSVMAYAAYMYALKELPVGFVTSYAYVNPLVAVILGYFVLQEPLNEFTIVAFVLILSGIIIVNSVYKKKRKLAAIHNMPTESDIHE